MSASTCAGCGWVFGGRSPAPPTPARVAGSRRSLWREVGLVVGLFTLWRIAGALAGLHKSGALARARWVFSTEQAWHLPSEVSVQRALSSHVGLMRLMDTFYVWGHIPVMAVFLGWLGYRHTDRYRQWRTTVAVFTATCLAVQFVPVAPPRMLPALGFVDTATRLHQSVYGSGTGNIADQLSAVPSVHVGWALLVALAVTSVGSTWRRWLVWLYPAATVLVVVATANHFWFDGLVAAALLGLVLTGQHLCRRGWPASSGGR